MAKKIALEIDVKSDTVGQANKKVENATTELRRLKRELASGGLTGKEFEEASKRAGQLQDAIGDVSSRVKNLASDTRGLDTLVSAAQGIAGGFAIAQGAAALFGDENEELQKTFVKLQATMTALNGLQALANSLNKDSALMTNLSTRAFTLKAAAVNMASTSLGKFKLALIATGIGAAVVAVGLLIANFDKVKKAVLDFIPGLAKVGGWFTKIKNAITDFIGVTSDATRAIDAQSAAFKKLNDDTEYNIALLKAQGATEKEIRAERKKQIMEEFKFLNRMQALRGSLTEEEITRQKELNIMMAALNTESNNEVIKSEEKKNSDKLAKQKEFRDKYISAQQVNNERILELISDQEQKELAKLKAKHEQEMVLAKQRGENLRILEELQFVEQTDLELKFEQGRTAIIAAEKAERDKLRMEEAKVNDDASKSMIENAKAREAAEIQANESIKQSTQQAFAALSMLFENGSKEQKAFALASIAVDTGRAIGQALANSQSPTPDNVLSGGLAGVAKFAAIAASILSGAAQARQVLKGGANFSASGSISQPTQQFQAPTLQQQTQGIRLQDNRVYVLESDISTTQKRVRTLESRSVID